MYDYELYKSLKALLYLVSGAENLVNEAITCIEMIEKGVRTDCGDLSYRIGLQAKMIHNTVDYILNY